MKRILLESLSTSKRIQIDEYFDVILTNTLPFSHPKDIFNLLELFNISSVWKCDLCYSRNIASANLSTAICRLCLRKISCNCVLCASSIPRCNLCRKEVCEKCQIQLDCGHVHCSNCGERRGCAECTEDLFQIKK